MTSLATAFLEVRADTRKVPTDLRSVDRHASEAGNRFGKIFARGYLGPLKGVGAAAAGILAVSGGISFFKDIVAEGTEAQKAGAQTAAVIKSTGGAANISAKQIGNLSNAISNKIGVDDEAIQSGANLLLTFKNIRNETGKGNDIFNQSVHVITDMSAALGQDMKSSSIQLGKALNDPIKGITALSRVGVTFDAGQKKQITTLAKHGHLLAAQKIILKELNSEFRGSAEAQVTPAEKAQVAWKNFEELLGLAVLPTVGKVANFLSKRVIPAMTGFVTGMQKGTGPGGKLASVVKGIFQAFTRLSPVLNLVRGAIGAGGGIGGQFDKTGKSIVTFGRQVLPPIKTFAHQLVGVLGPGVASIGKQISTQFLPAFRRILPILGPIAKFLLGMFGDALIGAIKGAIQVIRGVIQVISGVFNLVADLVHGKWKKAWKDLVQILRGALNIVVGAIKVWFNIGIFSIFKHGVLRLLESWRGLGDGLKTIGKKFLEVVRGIFDGVLKRIGKLLSNAISGYIGLWKRLFSFFRDVAVQGWKVLRSAFGGAFAAIRTMLSTVVGRMVDIWKGLFSTLRSVAGRAMDLVRGGIRGALDAIKGAFSAAVSGIGKIWGGLKKAALGPVKFVVDVVFNNGIRKVINAIPGVPDIGPIKGFDRGGYTGPGGKFQPAGIVHRDEQVIKSESRRSVEKRAPGFLDRLNAAGAKALEGLLPGYAGGGLVTYRPVRGGRLAQGIHDTSTGYPAIDIGVPIGTPVYAGTSGRVTTSRDLRGFEPRISHQNGYRSYGKYITIAGPSGIGTLYAHLSRRGVGVGAHVQGGQRIGFSGLTGHTYGPHLHFGARGTSPLVFLGGRAGHGVASGGSAGPGSAPAYSGPSLGDVLKYLNPASWKSHLNHMGPWGRMLSGAVGGMVGKVKGFAAGKIKDLIRAAGSVAGSILRGGGSKSGFHMAPLFARQAAFHMLPSGWSKGALDSIVRAESGWRWNADNPSSSAYGIPQALPGSKMASAGRDWHDNALTQIRWMIGYIRGRYGNSQNALTFRRSHGWYDQGGVANGAGYMPKRTIRPERVLSPRQTESFDRLVSLLERQGVGGSSAPFIGNAVIRETVDLERYERQRAFRARRTTV